MSLPSPAFSVEFLGTGTSTGVPMIGCRCAVCTSADPRDSRLRPSVLVRGPEGTLLIDTTPDMRTQLLRAGIDDLAAVLVTHGHADHILGMDDIRQLNFLHGKEMEIFGEEATLAHLRRVFNYCFEPTQEGGGKPRLSLKTLTPLVPVRLAGLEILPVTVLHGALEITSFVIERRFGYVTDVRTIPDATRPYLENLDALVLSTVRPEPHPTHLGLYEAIAEAQALGAGRTYFTHLSHHLGHAATEALLPEASGIALAYDGLAVELPACPTT
jgi:phosphoribosyl 1,2-cyclic phosphate phosphodiesterase